MWKDFRMIIRLWLDGRVEVRRRYPVPPSLPKPQPTFVPSDCCGADFKMEVWFDGAEKPLLFCMHHFRKALKHIEAKSYPFKERGAKL